MNDFDFKYQDSKREVKRELPQLVPVLPVRNTVLFPSTAVPLVVGRQKSIQSVQQALKNGDLILIVAQKDGTKESPTFDDLYQVGVIAQISKVSQIEDNGYQFIASGLFRYQVLKYSDTDGWIQASGIPMPEVVISNKEKVNSLISEIKQLGKSILTLANVPAAEGIFKVFSQIQDPAQISDLCSTFLQIPVREKQNLLEMQNLQERLEALIEIMANEKDRLLVHSEVQSKMMERLSKEQRENILKEQMRTIQEELNDNPDTNVDWNKKIEEAQLPEEAKKIAKEELVRLQSTHRSSPEHSVIKTYLEWLTQLPWNKTSAKTLEEITLEDTKKTLDEEHSGIDKVKKRILEYLSVSKLKNELKGPILCLVGPPGVGKTSIGQAIAKAMGRHLIRISLGGVRDEAEIRGHRRTYIGSMPGRIIQNIKRAKVKDPLILLDEIDKVGTDFRGDPASALLEVLDPEQNSTFTDHYLDTPFDLSKVFFICTANVVDTIPAALRDRLEFIEMTSYSKNEKVDIAIKHLIPKQLKEHGIKEDQLVLGKDAVIKIIEGYTREAGVRDLTRQIAKICRQVAQKIILETTLKGYEPTWTELQEFLGPERFHNETLDEVLPIGVAHGLAWTPVGGELLNIETTKMDGKGVLTLTGQLGDVMKESAQIALSLIRGHWDSTIPWLFDKTDIHIHFPAGAVQKDGPSGGVALYLALSSLLYKQSLPN
jgi:ATP-dependent Lon protease